MPDADNEFVTLGRIVGIHGVRGWVKVHSDTRPREEIFDYPVWRLNHAGDQCTVRLVEGRAQAKGLVACLEGYTDRDQAQTLIGSDIDVAADELPDLEPGQYYWRELEGLRVINRADQELGQVSTLMETGANDVLVVAGERERLIPYTETVIEQVDLDAGVIRVDWDADF